MATPLTSEEIQLLAFDLALAGLHTPTRFPPPPIKARLWSRNDIIRFIKKHHGNNAAKLAAAMPLFTHH